MSKWQMLGCTVLMILCAAPMWAQTGIVQTGCVNSPENPTAVLALVGCAGGAFSYLRARRRSRK